jgi:hypothetical protein
VHPQKYAFSRLAQNKMGTDIDIHNEHDGNSVVSYLPRRARLGQLLTLWPVPAEISIETFLPLRVLLGNPLIERKGGQLVRDESAAETETVRLEFLVREHRQES